MDFECAVSWNRLHPVGTRVWVRRVDGIAFTAKTAAHAQQWGSFAIVSLEGENGMWTTHALSLVDFGDGTQASVPRADFSGVADGS